jgi:hypothetical protein
MIMRLAISAATAMSGLALLGLAIYGQPAMYVHKAREQLNAWVGPSSGSSEAQSGPSSAEPPHAASSSDAPQPSDSHQPTVEQTPPPQAMTSNEASNTVSDGAPQGAAAQAPGGQRATANATNVPGTTANGVSDADRQRMAQLQREVQALRAQLAERQADEAASGPSNGSDVPGAPVGTPDLAAPETKQSSVGSTQPSTTTAAQPVKPAPPQTVLRLAPPVHATQPAAETPAMTIQPKPTAAPRQDTHSSAEVATNTLPRPAPPPVKAAPSPPAAAKPAPKAPEPVESDMQSVLARLRQSGSAQQGPAAPAQNLQPARAPAPTKSDRPANMPALPRLMLARAAMVANRADDAVRLLQEAQLQLVFRPVDTNGVSPDGVGQAASSVARSLEALSANNVANGIRFVDQAIANLNGNGTNSPPTQSDLRSTGYAPAYPPR